MLDKGVFVLSKSKAVEQYNIVRGLCDCVSYSFKTNPDVGRVLEECTDCSFCVHSVEALEMINDKSRVWFFAQAWDEREIGGLLRDGVLSFVVDNVEDLNVFVDYIGEKKVKANLMLRMRLKENTVHTGKYFVFGMYSREINKRIAELRGNKYVGVLGVHFHRKTQNVSEWSIVDELSDALDAKTFEMIDVLDIGGGLPVRYKNYSDLNIDGIFEKIKGLSKWLSGYGVKLMMEPGRFVCGPAVRLVSRVKKVYDNNVIVNCSVYNSAMDTIAANIKLLVEGELEDGRAYTVKGCTPCSTDIFRYRVFLDSPKEGDEIVFVNAGAYTYCTDFCCLSKLDVKVVCEGC